jgi:hypothetical protein
MNQQLFVVRLRQQYFDLRDDGGYGGGRLVRAFAAESGARAHRVALDEGRVCPPASVSPVRSFGSLCAGHDSVEIILRNPAGGEKTDWFDGTLDQLSTLGEKGFLERVRQLGFAPPEPVEPRYGGPPVRPWHTWWDAFAARATDEQRLAIWATFDLIYFFEICTVSCEV